MNDGFFASHAVCSFLRRAGVLKEVHAPEIQSAPMGSHIVPASPPPHL